MGRSKNCEAALPLKNRLSQHPFQQGPDFSGTFPLGVRLTCGSGEMNMRHRLLHQSDGQRTYAVVLKTDDEVMGCLKRFIADEKISAAQLTAIGALSDAVLLYFDWAKKDYVPIPVKEQVEVASLIGDVAEDPSGRPALHIHVVVGKRDGVAMAGHLGEAHVRPTLEVIVTESPAHLRKKKDSESGLALIEI
jgi:predicted DNA-binding protein with PD1-like motif